MPPPQIKRIGLFLLLACAASVHAADQSATVEQLIELDARSALEAAGFKTASLPPLSRPDAVTAPNRKESGQAGLRVHATWGVSGDKWAEIEFLSQPRSVKVGDTVAQWRVSEITDGCVLLVRSDTAPKKRGTARSISGCVAPSEPASVRASSQAPTLPGQTQPAPLPPLPAVPPMRSQAAGAVSLPAN